MPIEQFSFLYEGRKIFINVLFMCYDYGKYNGFFYIREIDNILSLNSSKVTLSQLTSSYRYKNLKYEISDEYYEQYELNSYKAPYNTLTTTPNNNATIKKMRDKFKATKTSSSSQRRNDDKIVKESAYINEDDDDEILLDEIGVLEYYFKHANKKKCPNFLAVWRAFLQQIRSPSNILKIQINRTCIDPTVTHVQAKKIIPYERPHVEYILLLATDSMIERNLHLITTSCNHNLTLDYLNQISEEEYYMTCPIPVLDSNRVYFELIEFIEKTFKSPYGRLRCNCKIFHLNEMDRVLSFLESRRTRIEFE